MKGCLLYTVYQWWNVTKYATFGTILTYLLLNMMIYTFYSTTFT